MKLEEQLAVAQARLKEVEAVAKSVKAANKGDAEKASAREASLRSAEEELHEKLRRATHAEAIRLRILRVGSPLDYESKHLTVDFLAEISAWAGFASREEASREATERGEDLLAPAAFLIAQAIIRKLSALKELREEHQAALSARVQATKALSEVEKRWQPAEAAVWPAKRAVAEITTKIEDREAKKRAAKNRPAPSKPSPEDHKRCVEARKKLRGAQPFSHHDNRSLASIAPGFDANAVLAKLKQK